MIFLSRRWLSVIAQDFGTRSGFTYEITKKCAQAAAADAKKLLDLMPWHLRILVGGVEIIASVWCIFDWLWYWGKKDHVRSLYHFEKWFLVSRPLLRLYRSLVAVSWFEQREVLAASGFDGPEDGQAKFRRKREAA